MENTRSTRLRKMVYVAILSAILLLMAFTPLGYLKTPVVEISFNTIPVVIGAIIVGPGAGAFLGGVFGATSFATCFGISAFGAMLLSINPLYTFLVCMVPRILMGWLTGLIFRALYRRDATKLLSFAVTSLSGALLNTVLFTGLLLVLFGRTEFIMGIRTALGAESLLGFVVAFVGLNGLLEAVACLKIGRAHV
jgi:uncharacterized membrane protein